MVDIKETLQKKGCKDCYWFNDCPSNYFCPATEVLLTIMQMQEDEELEIRIRKDILEDGE